MDHIQVNDEDSEEEICYAINDNELREKGIMN